jgi:CheY-like chemotaxis protein
LHSTFRVIESTEKSESFAAALVERPDLIVADLDLPDRIGFESIEMLRKHPSLGEIPIIGLSENRKRSDVLAAVKVGVNDYLIKKETTTDSLLQKVESWLKMLNQLPAEPGEDSDTGCLTAEEAQRRRF